MNQKKFEFLRFAADQFGPTVMGQRHLFMKEIIDSHETAYKDKKPLLYNVFYKDGVFNLDLTPVGLIVYIKEKFIFTDRGPVRAIDILNIDEYTKSSEIILSFHIYGNGGVKVKNYLNKDIISNGEQKFSGFIGNDSTYEIFFNNLFSTLFSMNLISISE